MCHDCDVPEQVRFLVPGYPGLALVSSDPQRYPPALLQRLLDCIVLPIKAPPACTEQQLRRFLRSIKIPEAIAGDAWVQARYGGEPEGVARFSAEVAQAISQLEQLQSGLRPDRRGALLRMRYLEGAQAKAVRQALFLSESHYHRLQTSGLRWLADRLNRAAELTSDRKSMGVNGEFTSAIAES